MHGAVLVRRQVRYSVLPDFTSPAAGVIVHYLPLYLWYQYVSDSRGSAPVLPEILCLCDGSAKGFVARRFFKTQKGS